ncbi:UNVERIFIED_CONTAM: hypothetical protein Scaly_2225200 [Sesamum calycinum]|uniref:Uncharacterized protein n=1 Tax=Sesamum calycinum TaxID=2727403 RepID=A0AAW2MCR5_9LAMI
MQQVGQAKERPFSVSVGEVNFSHAEDVRLETTRARCICSHIVLNLKIKLVSMAYLIDETLSVLLDSFKDSDKTVFERLQREFEAARASQTQEICLDGEQWNDGLLATIRERMICCLEGARIGIQYETSFAGEPCELFHCILESKSFLEKMTVIEHTIPFFLPIREAENDFLSSNAMKFIDYVGVLLQAYVDRREQYSLLNAAIWLWHLSLHRRSGSPYKGVVWKSNRKLYFSLPYHMIEFVLADFNCKVTVSLRYADLLSTLPSVVSVLAWPIQQPKKSWTGAGQLNRKDYGTLGRQAIPARLLYAEDALRTMSLPEAFAEIVLKMPEFLKETVPEQNSA